LFFLKSTIGHISAPSAPRQFATGPDDIGVRLSFAIIYPRGVEGTEAPPFRPRLPRDSL
jgi:hypothetical protein